jgi:hypothetical protein
LHDTEKCGRILKVPQPIHNLAASSLTGENRETAGKNRHEMAEKTTPEQIAEAQRLVREWKLKTESQ